MASLKKVAGFLRNARPLCSGLGGLLRPEWVAGLSGIHTFLKKAFGIIFMTIALDLFVNSFT
jgi:hypothetical protein